MNESRTGLNFQVATTADPDGNITMEREALTIESLSLAMAAHNSGALVIAQVERIAEARTLNPRQVKIPGAIVDCIVVTTKPESHMQTYGTAYNPAFASEVRVPMTSLEAMPMTERKIIARRAAMELRPNSVVNLGVTRFTTSALMHAKLGETLKKRGVAPHIFESEEEAKAAVRDTVPRE